MGARQHTRTRRERLQVAREKGTHTALEWEVLRHIFGGACVRCGNRNYRVEKDHIEPVYQGGSDAIWNLQPMCAPCNTSKGPEAIDHRDAAYPRWEEHFAIVMETLSERLR